MGTVELSPNHTITVTSHIITYGNAADEGITQLIRDEIETMWNEPRGFITIDDQNYLVQFKITAEVKQGLSAEEIMTNNNPRNNYFRIEEFAHGNISFVDGLGSNTGYFKLENLNNGSTTAAHEYGHTIGLDHPSYLDLRGKGVPGIMYPRGTIVDPQFQYDPTKPPGVTGGTMNPMHRKVWPSEIAMLTVQTLDYLDNITVMGDFSSIWHPNHSEIML
ncbi:MAG: peptidase M10 [Niabella sp.]|nr:MAG: peptidase M10 [Niabella sp.]